MHTTSTLRPSIVRTTRYLMMLVFIASFGFATEAQAQQSCSPNPPGWCVNPADFQSTMTVTGELIIGGTATTDTNDLVGAFVGNEVRGWIAGSNIGGGELRHFLTIYGNTGGETVTFKAYDASANEIRPVTETVTFTADAIVGSVGTPFLLNAPDGVPPGQILLDSPADGTTSLPVDVPIDLAWTEAADAVTYDLQVDDDAGFGSLEIDETGLVGSPYAAAGLQRETTYHWRVRGVNGNGDGPWSTSFSFTTLLNEPAAPPVLVDPADGAINTSLTPTLDWNTLPDATTYDVQLASDAAFTSLLVDEADRVATYFTVPAATLAEGTLYYWRVRGSNEGGPGPWAAAFDFTTGLSAPALTAPADGSTGHPTTVTLGWSTVPLADAYDVQVATDAGFTSIVDEQAGIPGTTGEVTGLSRGVVYHWRVRATNAEATSPWSLVFTFTTLIPEPAAAPTLTSPLNGAQLITLTPQLQWQATPAASAYDVQLATDEAFLDLLIDETGVNPLQFAVPAGLLAYESTYHWRVRGTNVGGAGPWATAFVFHTAVPPPDVPVLLSPQNGAIDQLMSLIVSWRAAARATYYEMQVATNPSFAAPLVDAKNIQGLTHPVTNLAPGAIYFWRVRGGNGTGLGVWSDPFSFATELVPPGGAPVLTSPQAGSTTDQEPLLRWQGVSLATRYEVQLSTSPVFAQIAHEANAVQGTSYQVPAGILGTHTTYYWRVRGANTQGPGPWSQANDFTTQQETLNTPVLTLPADGATGQQLALTLQWNTVGGGTGYDVEIATDNTFETIVAQATGVVNPTFSVPGLSPATTYYWRVQAKGVGTQSAWSSVWQFTTLTVAPVEPPAPESPADGTTTAGQMPTLTWSPLAGATTYDVQLATDASFSAGGGSGKLLSVIHEAPGLTSTQYIVPSGVLNAGVTYHWRIRGVNGAGPGPWSLSRQFSTPGSVPGAPVLTAPADGALEQPSMVTLTWAPAPGAGFYNVQIATDDGFSTPLANLVNVTQTSVAVSELVLSTVYYWRVQAENASGQSSWSPTFRFTTLITAPVPVSPADGAIAESQSPVLAWSPVAGAHSYTLEVSERTDFSRSVIYTGLAAESQRVSGLAATTVYYWRIRSKNEVAQSPWSSVFHFTTPMETSTAVETVDASVPSAFELDQNYPNPFNPVTTIRFGLPEASAVRLSIYDAMGRAVDEILNTRLSAGRFEVSWEAGNHPSGIYFYRLQTEGQVLTGKMMLVK